MDARHGRRLVSLWVAVLACLLLWGVRPAMRGGDGLAAQYYDNPTFTGTPASSIVDHTQSTARIARLWSDTVPAAFSVAWNGYLTVGRSGIYHFATTSDDGSRLYLDGRLVVDNGGSHGVETRSGQVELARGPHRVRLEYVQLAGDFEMAWSWAFEDGPHSQVPSWTLSQQRVGYGTALAARLVDLGRWSFAILAVLAATWYLNAWLGLANLIAVALVVAVSVPFDPIVSTAYYEYLVHLAFVRGLQWGVDAVSTYGPWGFVGLPLFHPATFRWMLLLNTLILAITALRIIVFIRRTNPPGASLPGLWAAMVLLPLTVIPVDEWTPALFCFPVIVIAISLEWISGKAVMFSPMDALSAFALGFLALVKLSAWTMLPALTLASWLQSRRHGLGFAVCFLIGALGGWLAAGQSLMHLGPFLRLETDIILGFKNGGTKWGASGLAEILFLAAAAVPWLALLIKFPPRSSRRWLAFLVPAAVFGQFFQAAFIRADSQHIVSNVLAMCAVAPLFVAAVLSDHRWRSGLPAAAIVIVTALLCQAVGSPSYSRPRAEWRSLMALVSGAPPALYAARGRSLAHLRADFPLPTLEMTGAGGLWTGDVGILEGSPVAFSLQPTLISYVGHTSSLAELNRSWLEHGGMEWVLWCGASYVDGRHPTELNAKALLYLATHFRYRSQVGRCALLRRESGPEWRADASEVRQLRFEQLLPIDAAAGSLVWAEISVRETFLGRLMRTFLKPAPVVLKGLASDGVRFRSDIFPSVTREGLLLSPLVGIPWDPLEAIADGRGSDQQLVEVQVEAVSPDGLSWELFYRPEVTVRLTTLRSPRSGGPAPPGQ